MEHILQHSNCTNSQLVLSAPDLFLLVASHHLLFIFLLHSYNHFALGAIQLVLALLDQ